MKSWRGKRILGLLLAISMSGCEGDGGLDGPIDGLTLGIGGGGGNAPGPEPWCASEHADAAGSPQVERCVKLQRGAVINGQDYTGVKDATLEAAAPSLNQGADPLCIADGIDQERACALRFSMVPIAGFVKSVELRLFVEDPSSSTYELYTLKRPWDQSAVSWADRLVGVTWDAPGAKAATDRDPFP